MGLSERHYPVLVTGAAGLLGHNFARRVSGPAALWPPQRGRTRSSARRVGTPAAHASLRCDPGRLVNAHRRKEGG